MERRACRISASQWDIMLDFLEGNPSLVRGYNNSSRGREQSRRLWRHLANLLNAEGSGASKEPKEWSTYFNNYKSKLKKTVSDLNQDMTATGGGPPLAESLSDTELRVMSLLGQGFGQGLPSVRIDPFSTVEPSEPCPALNVAVIRRVDTATSAISMDHDYAGEGPSVSLTVESLQTEEIDVEAVFPANDVGIGSGSVHRAAEVQPPQAHVPPLPRQRRHTRYRTRPMAPLDEARRILEQVEMARANADTANARANELIGHNLGRIATAMETYVALLQEQHRDGPQ